MRAARIFETDCTVEVSHTFEALYAHVELDADYQLRPADRVLVHGRPLNPPYGTSVTERRRATVTRATWLQRAWTRWSGSFECLELLDVSFSDRRQL